MEAIYEDFRDFLSQRNFDQARHAIRHMSDYSRFESQKMERELQYATRFLWIAETAIISFVLLSFLAVFFVMKV